MPTPKRFERLERALKKRQPDLTVLLELVHKPHNLWAITRTCDAVGVFRAHAVLLEDGTEIRDQISMGAAQWLHLEYHEHLASATSFLKNEGFRIVGAHPDPSALDYRDFDYTQPTALLFGTEKFGLSDKASRMCESLVQIPMQGLGHSLNVSVAAALLLYEASRQREAAGLYDKPRLEPDLYRRTLFEWAHPEVAAYCRRIEEPYPALDAKGQIVGRLPGRR